MMAEVPPGAEIQFPWTWNMTTSNASERSSEIKFKKNVQWKKTMRSQFKWGEKNKEQRGDLEGI